MVATPHDTLFKTVFSKPQNAREVLRTVLPAGLVAYLDFATLDPRPNTFVDEQLRSRFSDLLFTIRCDGHTAFIYLLFEHQSSADPLMPFRLLRYMTDIWIEYLREHPTATRLPAVIPVVLHHGADGWSAPTTMTALYDLPAEVLAQVAGLVPEFSLLLDDLSAQSDEALRRRALGVLPTLVLWTLKHARHEPDMVAAMRWVSDLIYAVFAAPQGIQALTQVLRYIMAVSATRSEELQHFLETEIHPMAHQAITTEAERLRQEGELKGQLSLVQDQLEQRFGPLPQEVQARLARAEVDALGRWARRLLTAQRLDEVFDHDS